MKFRHLKINRVIFTTSSISVFYRKWGIMKRWSKHYRNWGTGTYIEAMCLLDHSCISLLALTQNLVWPMALRTSYVELSWYPCLSPLLGKASQVTDSFLILVAILESPLIDLYPDWMLHTIFWKDGKINMKGVVHDIYTNLKIIHAFYCIY